MKIATLPELTHLDEDHVCAKLMDHLIPALTLPPSSTYHPADVTRWLTTFARYLQDQGNSGGNGTDIELEHLWVLAGPDSPRYLAAALHASLAAPFVLFLAAWDLLTKTMNVWGSLAIIVLPLSFIYGKAARPRVEFTGRFIWSKFRRYPWREHPTPQERARRRAVRKRNFRRGLRNSVWMGLFLGVFAGFCIRGSTEIRVAWTAGFAFGMVVTYVVLRPFGLAFSWLIVWFSILLPFQAFDAMKVTMTPPAIVIRPSDLVRVGIRGDLTFGLTWLTFVGLPLGILDGCFLTLSHLVRTKGDPPQTLASWILSLIFAWICFGVPVGVFLTAGSPWLRYLVAMRILARENVSPKCPAQFLDWAYDAGLLRLSGVTAQFRHSALQEHLAPAPMTGGSPIGRGATAAPTARDHHDG